MKENGVNYIADGIGFFLSVIQPNQVFQYISFGLTIIATLVSIAFTLVQLINWWKNAKKDGKLTEEEILQGKHLVEDIKNQVEDAKQHLDGKESKK